MKISVDLDGTAWEYPSFFTELLIALQENGNEVGVLTIHDDDLREADLRLWRARGFPEPDFFYNGADMIRMTPLAQGDVRERKIAFARRMGIHCHIDDFDNRHPGEIELVVLDERGA